jgi:hypothetical protein
MVPTIPPAPDTPPRNPVRETALPLPSFLPNCVNHRGNRCTPPSTNHSRSPREYEPQKQRVTAYGNQGRRPTTSQRSQTQATWGSLVAGQWSECATTPEASPGRDRDRVTRSALRQSSSTPRWTLATEEPAILPRPLPHHGHTHERPRVRVARGGASGRVPGSAFAADSVSVAVEVTVIAGLARIDRRSACRTHCSTVRVVGAFGFRRRSGIRGWHGIGGWRRRGRVLRLRRRFGSRRRSVGTPAHRRWCMGAVDVRVDVNVPVRARGGLRLRLAGGGGSAGTCRTGAAGARGRGRGRGCAGGFLGVGVSATGGDESERKHCGSDRSSDLSGGHGFLLWVFRACQ